nr:hypothetical protein [Mucilaginibacter sp. E4BP6]
MACMLLVTKSEKQKRASSRNRLFPYLQTADHSQWKKIIQPARLWLNMIVKET